MQSSEVKRWRLILLVAAAVPAAIVLTTPRSPAAEPSSEASCREAANGLVSLLDAKQDDTALYRDTYAVVVKTCGPAATSAQPEAPPSPPGRSKCHDLAAGMVDLIEDDRMGSPAFAKARDTFAAACAPR